MTKKKYIGQPDCWVRTKKNGVVCRKCRLPRTPEGHDPCIAGLPGVAFACCGHGSETSRAYVCFADGRVIRGEFDERSPEKLAEWRETVALPPFNMK